MEVIFVKIYFDYFEVKVICRIKDLSIIEGEYVF